MVLESWQANTWVVIIGFILDHLFYKVKPSGWLKPGEKPALSSEDQFSEVCGGFQSVTNLNPHQFW